MMIHDGDDIPKKNNKNVFQRRVSKAGISFLASNYDSWPIS